MGGGCTGRGGGSRGAGLAHLAHLQLEEPPLLLHLLGDLGAADLRADHAVQAGVLLLLLLDLGSAAAAARERAWAGLDGGQGPRPAAHRALHPRAGPPRTPAATETPSPAAGRVFNSTSRPHGPYDPHDPYDPL